MMAHMTSNKARLLLKLAMAEGFFLMLSRMDSATDAEIGAAEIRMIEAHRAVQEAQ